MKAFFYLLVALIFVFAGCGGPLEFNPPDSLLYKEHSKISPKTIGIYIAPVMKQMKFTPCEKLLFGSTQCYTGDIGKILESNALAAYSKGFEKVVILNSPDDISGVDAAYELSYKSVELKTTLDGVVAYRNVIVSLEQKRLYPKGKKSEAPMVFTYETKCEAWKCRVGGVDKGMSGTEVVLKQLFLPGFAFGGYGKALANIVNTAFCASLKEVLEDSVNSLKKDI